MHLFFVLLFIGILASIFVTLGITDGLLNEK